MSVVFAHLSDIHFRSGLSETLHDLDLELRQQLVLDAQQVLDALPPPAGAARGAGAPVDGILVSGGVAFAGAAAEYEMAGRWFAQLCSGLGCDVTRVWTIPGNHDCDRGAVGKALLLQLMHEKLRGATPQTLDAILRQILQDDEAAALIYRPFTQYNAFAARYECDVRPNQTYWEQRFPLEHGVTLVVRGVNSVLVSSGEDDTEAHKLAVGAAAARLDPDPDLAYLFMCHHPPTWLKDAQPLADQLAAARLQIYGHEHRFRVRQTDGNVHLYAAALHPERNSNDGAPGYNVLRIRVEPTAHGSELVTEVYARTWSEEHRRFLPKMAADGRWCTRIGAYSRRAPPGPRARPRRRPWRARRVRAPRRPTPAVSRPRPWAHRALLLRPLVVGRLLGDPPTRAPPLHPWRVRLWTPAAG